MSFMAGFGQAFSNSFENARARTAKKEDDIFKMTFSTYLESDKERKTAEKADAQNVKKATALAETIPGINKKAATAQIYKMLNSGLDEDFILEELKKPGATVDFAPPAEKDKLEEQTDAMLAPGSSKTKEQNIEQVQTQQEQPAGASKPGSWRDSFAGGLFNSPYSKKEKAADKAKSQISEATGRPLDEINQTLSGAPTAPALNTEGLLFTPGASADKDQFATLNSAAIEQAQAQEALKTSPSPANQERVNQANIRMEALVRAKNIEAQAKAAAEGIIVPGQQVKVITPDGSITFPMVTQNDSGQMVDVMTGQPIQGKAAPLGEDELKNYEALAKDVQKPTDDYLNKVTALTSVVRNAGDMGTLVDVTGGAVLADRTSRLAQYVQGWGAEAATLMQGYENLKASGNTVGSDPEMTFAIDDMEKRVNSLISQGVADIGTARALYEAKVKILAYKLASMEGQDGRGLAEIERKMFEELASGGTDINKFNQNMANIIFSRLGDLQTEAGLINSNNRQIEAFQKRYNWPKPPFAIAGNPEETIMEDPALRASYERFQPYNNLSVRSPKVGPASTAQGGQMNKPAPVAVRTPEEAKALEPGTQFIIPSGPRKGEIATVPERR